MTDQEITTLLLLLAPVILIQVGLVIYCLVDLARRARTRGPRWAWALGMALTGFGVPAGLIVAGLYLAWGRNVET
jgi:hypothetical protein